MSHSSNTHEQKKKLNLQKNNTLHVLTLILCNKLPQCFAGANVITHDVSFIIANFIVQSGVLQFIKKVPLIIAQIVQDRGGHDYQTSPLDGVGVNKVESSESLLEQAECVFYGYSSLRKVLVKPFLPHWESLLAVLVGCHQPRQQWISGVAK